MQTFNQKEEVADNPYRACLTNLINWADLVLKNPEEFNGHGVQLMTGPFFDQARDLLEKGQMNE